MEAAPSNVLRGVPLVQLAAVHAAVAEGFTLDEVLAVEALPEEAWFEAELSWKARLVSEAEEMDRYSEELSRQQDRLARRVDPLEDDVDAWIRFLRCYEAHSDPFDLLDGLGLCLNDMARLGRRWSQRFDEDTKVAQQAAKLAQKHDERLRKGEAPRLPRIEVSPAALSPSPVAGSFQPAATSRAQATRIPSSAPVLGLDQYAALSADLRVAAERDHADVLARYGVDARHAVDVDEAWRARLESDPELRADFRVLVRHYEQTAALRKRAAARPLSQPAPSSPRWASADRRPWSQPSPVEAFLSPLPIRAPAESVRLPPAGTAPGVVMAHMEVLPFRGSITSMPPVAERLPPRPPRREGDIDATGDVIPALRDSEIMPFGGDEGTAAPPSDNLDGTMLIGAIRFEAEDALPFRGEATPPPLSKVTIIPSSRQPRADGHSASDLDTTGGLLLSLSDSDVLPFHGSLDTSQGVVISFSDDDFLPAASSLDTTADFVALPDDDALPFQPAASRAEPDPGPASSTAPLPGTSGAGTRASAVERTSAPSHQELDATAMFQPLDLGLDDAPEAKPATAAAPPAFTLEQLASFHAELAVAPHDHHAIRTRYGLDAAAQTRVEHDWRARFAHSAQEHAAYHQKLAQFRAWLASQKR